MTVQLTRTEKRAAARQQAPAALAKRSTYHFMRYVSPRIYTGDCHRLMCLALDWWLDTPGARLGIVAPPRHMKSTTTQHAAARAIGLDPDTLVMSASCTMRVAEQLSRKTKQIVKSKEFKELFPGVVVGGEDRADTIANWQFDGRYGQYWCAGTGGDLISQGANLQIGDDLIQGHVQAYSRTYRDTAGNWYQGDWSSRQQADCRELLSNTRWHHDDVMGRILREERDNPSGNPFHVLHLPAIMDDPGHRDWKESDPWIQWGRKRGRRIDFRVRQLGDCLWPERLQGGKPEFDHKYFAKFQRWPAFWECLYQGRPSASEGGIFKRSKMQQRYKVLPERFDQVVIAMDCTYKDSATADFVHIAVWGRLGSRFYLLDEHHDRLDLDGAIDALRAMSEKWPQAYIKYVEATANGPEVIAALRQEIGGIVPVKPQGSKEARAQVAALAFQAGDIWLPDESIAPWIAAWCEEHVNFPGWPFDDRVDTTSMALNPWITGGIHPGAEEDHAFRPTSHVLTPERASIIASERLSSLWLLEAWHLEEQLAHVVWGYLDRMDGSLYLWDCASLAARSMDTVAQQLGQKHIWTGKTRSGQVPRVRIVSRSVREKGTAERMWRQRMDVELGIELEAGTTLETGIESLEAMLQSSRLKVNPKAEQLIRDMQNQEAMALRAAAGLIAGHIVKGLIDQE